MTKTNPVKFKRIGRSYHMKIETAGDLQNILDLDEALWVATNAPLSTIHCDPTFLSLIDADQTGRITCREIKQVVRWLSRVLQDHTGISQHSQTLVLSDLNTNHSEGRTIHTAAEKVLTQIDNLHAGEITLEQLQQFKADSETRPSGQAGVGRVDLSLLEKVILYQAGILDLANNFVSFPHLYDPNRRAMFEMGTLVMDGRRFNFAVKVENRDAHVEVAKTSNMFVMYIEVIPKHQEETYEVAVPVTSGGKGNLYLGKHGVFLDVNRRECDAKVVHIVENPISYREALISPFLRLGRTLTGKIESFTAERETKWDTYAAQPPSQIDKAAETRQSRLFAGGLLVGGGVAIAAISSAFAYIAKSLAGVPPWKILVGIGGSILVVMLPITIVAFLKLRKRDLSAILEGSGWGINARMRLTHKQGWFFTEKPKHPPGSKELM